MMLFIGSMFGFTTSDIFVVSLRGVQCNIHSLG